MRLHDTKSVIGDSDRPAPFDTSPQSSATAETQEKVENITKKAQRILLRVSSVFPFDFFPDELIVDEAKVSVISHHFWAAHRIYSIPFSELIDVVVETAPIFATLRLRDRGWDKSVAIKYLKKDDALQARKIIQGVQILNYEKVDIVQMDKNNLISYIEQIGSARKNMSM